MRQLPDSLKGLGKSPAIPSIAAGAGIAPGAGDPRGPAPPDPARPRLFCSAAPGAGAAAPRGAGDQPGVPRRAGRTGRREPAESSNTQTQTPTQTQSPSRGRAGTRSGGQGLTTDRHLAAPAGAGSPPPIAPLPARGCGAAQRTLSPRRARLPADNFLPLLRSSQPQRRLPHPLARSVHPPAPLSLPPSSRAGRRSGEPDPAPRFPGLCLGWAGTGDTRESRPSGGGCRAAGSARPAVPRAGLDELTCTAGP